MLRFTALGPLRSLLVLIVSAEKRCELDSACPDVFTPGALKCNLVSLKSLDLVYDGGNILAFSLVNLELDMGCMEGKELPEGDTIWR